LTGQEEAIEEGTDIMFDLPSSNLDLQDTRAFAITIKADLPISKINQVDPNSTLHLFQSPFQSLGHGVEPSFRNLA
jgi:hypothetical protein